MDQDFDNLTEPFLFKRPRFVCFMAFKEQQINWKSTTGETFPSTLLEQAFTPDLCCHLGVS